MWASTNPIQMMPVTAITYFLPSALRYSSTGNGARRPRAPDASAVPVTGPRADPSRPEP